MTSRIRKTVGSPSKGRPEEYRTKWWALLDRLDADLTSQEQADECVRLLVSALDEKNSRYLLPFVLRMYSHWDALGLRRLAKRGQSRHAHTNVSLQGLLLDFTEHLDIVLALANAGVRATKSKVPSTQRLLAEQIAADFNALCTRSRGVFGHANTIAHLQIEDDRIRGSEMGECRRFLRSLITNYGSLVGWPGATQPSSDHFVAGLEGEIDTILLREASAQETG